MGETIANWIGFRENKTGKARVGTDRQKRRTKDTEDKRQGQKQKKKKRREDSGKHSHIG